MVNNDGITAAITTGTARLTPTLATEFKEKQQPLQQQILLPSFPCLEKLTIGHCPKLTTMPLHPFLKELEFRDVRARLVEQSIMVVAS